MAVRMAKDLIAFRDAKRPTNDANAGIGIPTLAGIRNHPKVGPGADSIASAETTGGLPCEVCIGDSWAEGATLEIAGAKDLELGNGAMFAADRFDPCHCSLGDSLHV
jgi:hypothetical protein